MKILFAASEAVPFSKTGGLGDVCGALPKALKKRGHDVRVILPRAWNIDKAKAGLKPVLSPMGVSMGQGTVWCSVLEGKVGDVPFYFVEHEGYFGRAGLYDDGKREYADNAERFGFFSRACLQLCRDLPFQPDILHAHDWPTALAPVYLKTLEFLDPFFRETASVYSIHNLSYQGVFRPASLPFLGLSGEFTESKLEAFGGLNFMKAAIFFSDMISTVSPAYAEEILSEPGGNGLSVYLQRRRGDLLGILNGADYEQWDPAKDRLIPARYSPRDMAGKAVCKRELQKEFLLENAADVPVIGVVSRFVSQKGLQLLAPVIKDLVRNMRVQFVLLGSGEKGLEDFFGGLPAEFPGKVGAWIGYDEGKAHRIEAGADFFLMPSLYEPCGLNQIYSMKYGTLPIVRATGGLKDTVRSYREDLGTGTGFCFEAAHAGAIYNTVGWAVSTYYDRPRHVEAMRKEAMAQDFSWEKSALRYEEIYEKALARRSLWT
ncbi:MAG TPA: glycogen synthase GlgA [Verrucomicrobiae bacterium]|nr:glycogen synthase GlgA [Verrucomicrobiae bacterium]